MKKNRKNLHLICDNDTDLVVEGFPRSSNTFFVDFIHYLTYPQNPLKMAHHTHSTDNLELGILYKKPCLVLIREPVEAITSFAIHSNNGIPEVAKRYTDFYSKVQTWENKVSISDFETIVNDINSVISDLNNKFSLEIPLSTDMKRDSLIISDIDRKRSIEKRTKEEYTRTVGAPDRNRDKIKEAIKPEVLQYVTKNKHITKLYNDILNSGNCIQQCTA